MLMVENQDQRNNFLKNRRFNEAPYPTGTPTTGRRLGSALEGAET
jgi:hypothetical protein